MKTVSGNYVDIFNQKIFKAELQISKGKIIKVVPRETVDNVFLIPGLIDSHVHIESSMLVPSEFAKLAVQHGTVSVVTDPHEIANVCGVEGVDYMIRNGETVPLKFYFGAPSCVPATSFETSGFGIDSSEVHYLLSRDDVFFLAEMMNFPGVVYDDSEVVSKIEFAKRYNKPIDGHAPGLSGDDLNKYANAGVSTDHECMTIEEAEEKIKLGMKIQIREGSAAKNFDALSALIDLYPGEIMLCTDDCHPDNLMVGHVDAIIKKGIEKGLDVFNLIKAATIVPVEHYGIDSGLLREGDSADIVAVDNLTDFNVLKTYINGELVCDDKDVKFNSEHVELINNFVENIVSIEDICVTAESEKINVIEVLDGELLTFKKIIDATVENGLVISDTDKDVLKIIVQNRYEKVKPVIGFIKNFGLKKGAIAGSIAHDSHNLIAIGVEDSDLVTAINAIQKSKGGISVCDNGNVELLELPVAGLMSDKGGFNVAREYHALDEKVKELGCSLKAPFMTMAFMSLLVIPEFKIGDKGLFDGVNFKFDSLFVK